MFYKLNKAIVDKGIFVDCRKKYGSHTQVNRFNKFLIEFKFQEFGCYLLDQNIPLHLENQS